MKDQVLGVEVKHKKGWTAYVVLGDAIKLRERSLQSVLVPVFYDRECTLRRPSVYGSQLTVVEDFEIPAAKEVAA